MDITNKIIEINGGLLTSLLIYKEFSFEQSVRFLPEAVRTVVNVVSLQDVSQFTSSDSTSSVMALMQKIDIDLLALNTSIEPILAKDGMLVLLPKIMGLISSSNDGGMSVEGSQKTVWFSMDKKDKAHCDE